MEILLFVFSSEKLRDVLLHPLNLPFVFISSLSSDYIDMKDDLLKPECRLGSFSPIAKINGSVRLFFMKEALLFPSSILLPGWRTCPTSFKKPSRRRHHLSAESATPTVTVHQEV